MKYRIRTATKSAEQVRSIVVCPIIEDISELES
jgi:hypothetical protein